MPRYHIQVLDRVFRALDALSDHDGLSVTELSAKLGLHKSTTHRIVMVLELGRYVEKDLNGKLHVGPRLMELGAAVLSRLDVFELAKPHLRALVTSTGEAAHLGVVREGEVVSLVYIQSGKELTKPSTVGARTPSHCSSIGKAILAYSDVAEVEGFLRGRRLKAYTLSTITSAKSFREELKHVRLGGYALDNEEYEAGLRCLGAPLWDGTGQVVGGISIAGPIFRITEDRIPRLSSSVKLAAKRISLALGYREPKRFAS